MLKELVSSDESSKRVAATRAILDAFVDPVALMDARGTIRDANTAWHRLSGESGTRPHGDELAILAAQECMQTFNEIDRNAIIAGIESVLSGARARVEIELRTSGPEEDEAQRWFVLVVTPCHGVREVAALVHLRDVTQQKKVEIALRASEDSLSWAQQIGKMGNWDWDIPTGALRWSDEIFRIFGHEPRAIEVTYEAFLGTIYPDDREKVVDAVNKAVHESAPYTVEHRIVLPTGEVRFVHEQGKVFYGAGGKPLRMLGTVQDITERRRSADMIRLQAELNEELEVAVAQRTEELRLANERLERELHAREEAEEERVALQDEVIRVQRALLEEMSTPLIPIRKDIMVLPLIGAIDAQRAEQMLSTVLNVVVKQHARVVIVDITGVRQIDTYVANTLIRMAHALGLVGAEVVLTGMRPDVARALVDLNVTLGSIVVRGTLESGITYASTRRSRGAGGPRSGSMAG